MVKKVILKQMRKSRTAKPSIRKATRSRVTFGRVQTKRTRLPTSIGTARSGGQLVSFGQAPYHETQGAGLRLTLRQMICRVGRDATAENRIFICKHTTALSTVTEQYDTMLTSAFVTSLSNRYSCIWNTDTTVATFCSNLFGIFSQYCVRKFVLRYVPTVGTTSGPAIAFALVAQTNERANYGTAPQETTFVSISSIQKSGSNPTWKPTAYTLINDHDMSRPAVRLYDVSIGDQQFAIIGAVSDNVSSSTDRLGYIEMDAVVDLYGQRGASEASSSGLSLVRDIDRQPLKSEKDEKESRVYDTNYFTHPPTTISQSTSSVITSVTPSTTSSSSFRTRPV